MLKILLTTIATAALALVSITADARSLDQIIRDGTLRVGVNPNFPPMSSYGRTNQIEGFDVDIANAIGEALGVGVQLVPTETAQRVPFLTSGRIDIALKLMAQGAYHKSFGSKRPIQTCLADEIVAAFEKNANSHAIAKKLEVERQADSSR